MPRTKSTVKRSDRAKIAGELRNLREEVIRLKKELKDKEWASKKTNESTNNLYKELEKKNEQLKKLDQLKSQFVADVSHEFKNPLTTTGESLRLLLDGVVGQINPKQKEILEIGKKTIDRLVRLVTDLLDLSKIEAGKLQMKRTNFGIVPLVNEILKDYERELYKKQIALTREFAQDVGLFWADRDKVNEVIVNLLNNAIKYTPNKGNITIKIEGSKEEIRFEISDTGPGIPKEHFQTIFDKFVRIAYEKEEGTGLGLPITKDIIELHRGKIWVESEPGKGSKFIFTLPRDLRKKKRVE